LLKVINLLSEVFGTETWPEIPDIDLRGLVT
jgi:hypothetical protein